MGCGLSKSMRGINMALEAGGASARSQYITDTYFAAMNEKYKVDKSLYADTVWGVRLGHGYSGVRHYYYKPQSPYAGIPGRYAGHSNAYERGALYRHNAVNEESSLVYAGHSRAKPYEAANVDTEIKAENIDPVEGIIYLAQRQKTEPINERATDLMFRIQEEKLNGVESSEVINFSERARELHERIRRERMDGEMREAA